MKQLIQNCSRHKIAIGFSGSGTTFEAIAKAIKTEKLNLDLALVFADRKCLAVERAKQFGFSSHIRKENESIEDFHQRIKQKIIKSDISIVILAGYLRLFPISREDPFLVLNSHPAAIPYFGGAGFWGIRVHEAVIDFLKSTKFRHPYTYSTVHIAVEEYDRGPILGIKRLRVEPKYNPQDLAQRLLPIEHQNYIEVLRQLSNNVIEYQNYPVDLVIKKENPTLSSVRKKILMRYNKISNKG